jgi:PAS domain S-box-containing protein
MLILFAFERFFNQKQSFKFNIILIVSYLIVQVWFTYYSPNLAIRNLNISTIFAIICLQILYLIYFRLSKSLRRYTNGIAIVFSLYLLVNLSRIIEFFCYQHDNLNYFKSGPFETYVIFSFVFIFVLLTFSIVVMINRRLLSEIAVQEEKYFKVFNESPHAILLTRKVDGKIFQVNQGFETLSGYSSSEVVGKSTLVLNLWENEAARQQIVFELQQKGKVRNVEKVFRQKDGNLIYASISVDLIKIEEEDFILSTIEDIREQKLLLDELKLNAEELSSINATKDKLFSIIAHDLRGPFANIINLSEILMSQVREKDYAEIDDYANMIQNSTQKVAGLLTNLLEWSRLKTGKISFIPAPHKLADILGDTLDLLGAQAAQKEISITNVVDRNLIVNIDKNMFSTIIRNLVSNAIKFTNKGGNINIKIDYKDQLLRCSIKDDGVGMDQHKLDKLFRIEEKVSTPGTNNEQGTGLGLILCKEFVDLHHGEINATSELGKGTNITFTLLL